MLEACLQVVTLVSPKAARLLGPEVSGAIPDAILGWRGNPEYPEHDAAGYRNHDRPGRAAVVVLGDSQAYGVGVSRDEAWPHLLESWLGTRVYSMAMPGYSPAEALLQFDEALSLSPQQVIVSVYFGNDFFDAFALSMWSSRIGAMAPPQLLRASRTLEDQRSLRKEAEALSSADTSGVGALAAGRLRDWLAYHSRLYGLARAAKRFVIPPADSTAPATSDFKTVVRGIPAAKLRYWMVADRPHWRTILTPPYRALVLDDRDVRIRLGVEVVTSAVKSMAERSRAAGVDFLVVLVPTKEAVFWPHVDQHQGVLAELVANETRLKKQLTDDLKLSVIDVVDVTDVFREADSQPYFESSDGHPDAAGHRLIADAVGRYLAGRRRRKMSQ